MAQPNTLMVDDIKYVREDSIQATFKTVQDHPYPTGKNVFIRTVTMNYTGKLVAVTEKELVLEDVAWIADSGRFNEALKSGKLNEVEPFPAGKVIIGRDGAEVSIWAHALPREVK